MTHIIQTPKHALHYGIGASIPEQAWYCHYAMVVPVVLAALILHSEGSD